jgi:hypothetical protein
MRQDGSNNSLPPSQAKWDSVPGEMLRQGERGYLSPEFVESLMGFPPGWTDTDGQPLRDLSTPESLPGPDPASQTTEGGCTPLETPSCRSAAR